jgi:hypothetical protein
MILKNFAAIGLLGTEWACLGQKNNWGQFLEHGPPW